jgi:hypothetical protein
MLHIAEIVLNAATSPLYTGVVFYMAMY